MISSVGFLFFFSESLCVCSMEKSFKTLVSYLHFYYIRIYATPKRKKKPVMNMSPFHTDITTQNLKKNKINQGSA